MAGTTPNYGLPYPQSSDLVSAYPALGQDLATDLDGILAAKANTVTQATAPTGNAQVIWYDSSTTPPTPKFWDGSAWQPFSTGGILRAADVTGTTGSPTISTATIGGISYTLYRFTGSGSITFNHSGLKIATVFLCGAGGGGSGGASGSSGGGGGGGGWVEASIALSAAAYSVVVGGTTAASSRGSDTTFAGLAAVGGGRGGNVTIQQSGVGGSAGGAFGSGAPLSTGIAGQGYGTDGFHGGGQSGMGLNASGPGAGRAETITGSSGVYGAGGFGSWGSVINGGANTGDGGSGGNGGVPTGGNGGSGVVIVRVRS